jgi:pimeloyl-ACP methyl ester carboxylesterase
VLNAIVEAIVELKERYLWYMRDNDRAVKCILVAHDWGGLIAYRIAAETENLVDRVVAINTVYVSGSLWRAVAVADRTRCRW